MTVYEIIAVLVSIFGLGLSTWSIFKAHNAHKIAQGQIELNIHQLLNQTKKDEMEISVLIAEKCSDGDKEMKDILMSALNSAIESNLNAYEEACAKYLDGKVDKERFKKNYNIEIRQLVENKNYANYFNPTTSTYKAILKVYKQWNDLEN